jgi:hypothetical protein
MDPHSIRLLVPDLVPLGMRIRIHSECGSGSSFLQSRNVKFTVIREGYNLKLKVKIIFSALGKAKNYVLWEISIFFGKISLPKQNFIFFTMKFKRHTFVYKTFSPVLFELRWKNKVPLY